MNKEMKAFVARLRRAGYVTKFGGSGHLKVYEPGKGLIATISVTPSNGNWLKAAERDIRKHGSLPLGE